MYPQLPWQHLQNGCHASTNNATMQSQIIIRHFRASIVAILDVYGNTFVPLRINMAAILQNGKISPCKALLLIYRMLYNSEIHQIKLFQGNDSVCWTFSFTLAESSAL